MMVLSATLVACSSGRSLEAYCATISAHKDRYLSAMEEVNDSGNPLTGLTGLVSALGDLGQMWEEAEKVAPEEIQPDVADVAEWWNGQSEAAEEILSDPLKGLAGSLMSGFQNAGAIQRVDEYTAENCPDVGAMFFDAGAVSSGDAAEDDDEEGATPTPRPSSTSEAQSGESLKAPVNMKRYGPVLAGNGNNMQYFRVESGRVEAEIERDDSSVSWSTNPTSVYVSGEDPLRIAVLLRVRQPSSGLEPEKFIDKIFETEVDSAGTRVISEWTLAEVGEYDEALPHLVGSAQSGVVVVAIEQPSSAEDGELVLQAHDVSTGELLWSRSADQVKTDRDGVLLIGSEYAAPSVCNDDYRWDFALVDVVTGADIWTASGSNDVDDRRDLGCVVVDMDQTLLTHVRTYVSPEAGQESTTVTDLETGVARSYPSFSLLEDPVGSTIGVFVRSDGAGTTTNGIQFEDVETGAALFLLEGSRIDDLDLTAVSLFDGLLYAETTDEQIVIDVRTGEELGTWSVSPMDQLGDYTMLSDSTLVRDWSYSPS